jgi:hypothetical protein
MDYQTYLFSVKFTIDEDTIDKLNLVLLEEGWFKTLHKPIWDALKASLKTKVGSVYVTDGQIQLIAPDERVIENIKRIEDETNPI